MPGKRLILRNGLRLLVVRYFEQDRFAGFKLVRILRLGKNEIELRQGIHTGDDLAGQFTHLVGKFGQDAAHFIPFGDLGLRGKHC